MSRIFALLCLAASLQGETITAAFSDPSRPGILKLRQSNGSITVRGYSGKDVLIEANPNNKHGKSITRTQEDGNRLTITLDPNSSATIQVPFQTALQLQSSNGSIRVEKVQGEIDVQSSNGSIDVRGAASAVVAHSTNGSINVAFDKVDARRPMSFSSMNGKIDVIFPADLKANLKVQHQRGSLHCDFDLNTNAPGPEIQFKSYNGGVNIRRAQQK